MAGCTPIQQAPLVYSSKQAFGIGVSAGTPESAGLDVTIGYKGVDAAYVPVAVAKPCPATTACPASDYALQIVRGSNAISGKSEQNEKLIEDKQKQIETAVSLIRANSARQAEIDRDLARIDTLPAKNAELAAATPDPLAQPGRTLTGPEQERRSVLQAEVASIQLLATNRSKLVQEKNTLEPVTKKAAEKLVADQRALEDLIARRNEMNADDKSDALSVYGTFNGNAGGKATGAELSLGKVFSTGVAAQNLSQGVAASEKIRSTAQCLDALDRLMANASLDAAKKQEIATQVSARCGLGTAQR